MTTPAYRIRFEPDDNGTLLVTCDAFPEVTTFGEDEARGARNALGAIEEAIAARIADGREVPSPDPRSRRASESEALVPLPVLTALKVLLYRSLHAEGLTRAELARRLGWHREQVDRLFRLDHASRMDQIELAFHALDQEVEISVNHRGSGESAVS